jgi:hypothetical protein
MRWVLLTTAALLLPRGVALALSLGSGSVVDDAQISAQHSIPTQAGNGKNRLGTGDGSALNCLGTGSGSSSNCLSTGAVTKS